MRVLIFIAIRVISIMKVKKLQKQIYGMWVRFKQLIGKLSKRRNL